MDWYRKGKKKWAKRKKNKPPSGGWFVGVGEGCGYTANPHYFDVEEYRYGTNLDGVDISEADRELFQCPKPGDHVFRTRDRSWLVPAEYFQEPLLDDHGKVDIIWDEDRLTAYYNDPEVLC